MKYAERRPYIKSGDILAWTHKEAKSWYDLKVLAVRAFTMSEYTHVGIAWVYAGRVFVIESVMPVIRIVPLSNLLPCYVIHMKQGWNQEAEDRAMELIGKGAYSQWEAIKAYFGLNNDPEAWECGELVLEICSKNGIDLKCKAVPSDIVAAAQAFGSLERLEA